MAARAAPGAAPGERLRGGGGARRERCT